MHKLENLLDLERFNLDNESMLTYFGLKEALEILAKSESETEISDRKVHEWTINFVSKINPFLWHKWFECIFVLKKIPLYRSLLFVRNGWEWFGKDKDEYGSEKTYKLSNLWGFVGTPEKAKVLKALKHKEIKLIMEKRISEAFSAFPKPPVRTIKISKFTGKSYVHCSSATSGLGFYIPAVGIPSDDPSTIFWSIKNLREFGLSKEKTIYYKKLIINLLSFISV